MCDEQQSLYKASQNLLPTASPAEEMQMLQWHHQQRSATNSSTYLMPVVCAMCRCQDSECCCVCALQRRAGSHRNACTQSRGRPLVLQCHYIAAPVPDHSFQGKLPVGFVWWGGAANGNVMQELCKILKANYYIFCGTIWKPSMNGEHGILCKALAARCSNAPGPNTSGSCVGPAH
jgi:hypothetical protein